MNEKTNKELGEMIALLYSFLYPDNDSDVYMKDIPLCARVVTFYPDISKATRRVVDFILGGCEDYDMYVGKYIIELADGPVTVYEYVTSGLGKVSVELPKDIKFSDIYIVDPRKRRWVAENWHIDTGKHTLEVEI